MMPQNSKIELDNFDEEKETSVYVLVLGNQSSLLLVINLKELDIILVPID